MKLILSFALITFSIGASAINSSGADQKIPTLGDYKVWSSWTQNNDDAALWETAICGTLEEYLKIIHSFMAIPPVMLDIFRSQVEFKSDLATINSEQLKKSLLSRYNELVLVEEQKPSAPGNAKAYDTYVSLLAFQCFAADVAFQKKAGKVCQPDPLKPPLNLSAFIKVCDSLAEPTI